MFFGLWVGTLTRNSRENTDMTLPRGKLGFLFLILFIAALVWLTLLKYEPPRTTLNFHSAVMSLQDLNRAEQTYAGRYPDAGFACDLGVLNQQSLIPIFLASGTSSGYRFELRCLRSGTEKVVAYTITAVPTEPGTTGTYVLCTDQNGEIWYAKNGPTGDCFAKRKPIPRQYR